MIVKGLVVFVFVFVCVAAEEQKNNACKTIFSYHFAAFSRNCYHNPNVLSNATVIATKRNYTIKSYTVTTNDSYILTIFRLNSKTVPVTKAPVFLQHGIIADCTYWMNIQERSLAFYLADRGYEVWLGNTRGTIYSQKHQYYTDHKFWDYNLDDMAANDIPAMLDLVTQESGKVIYIGHSQGTTLFFMFASRYPSWAGNLVQVVLAFAPVVYLDGLPQLESIKSPGMTDIFEQLQIKGVLHQSYLPEMLTNLARLMPNLFRSLLNLLVGYTDQFSPDDLLVFYSHWASGTSIYQFKQFLQIAISQSFQMFDYGGEANLAHYGQKTPPVYDLAKFDLDVYIFYGEEDVLYSSKNLQRLLKELGSSKKEAICVSSGNETFHHVDFGYSNKLVTKLYPLVMSVLNKY